ncbi:spermatogenesis-associated protein 5-like protein 1 isoform X1 [Cyprinus carpio]|uniref:Spermatogenesis-associated protein 5-like protein 1 isoform X1 n=1 Tax=Cyprinus carpio TaxID=7962 RepID=A0A9Q9Z567_CYPCA|nr:spermatogenesis-associated protein 5-like protein 1 isoform X1 [Cyprinus carpio]XP_042631611.1 spermatogenesis-associated protein 5-like protein 1 isoform X1 [Cyprinus carpio]
MHGGFLQLLKKRKELIPLIGIVGCAALGATAASIYFLLTKPDVILNKTRNPEPWETLDPSTPQKMELQEVCNKDVLIVAATNRPEVLDSALLRPGRLDQIVYVPPPDLEARVAVLRVCTESVPLHPDVCLQDLAAQTELFSGADLQNLCREAALLALREDGLEVSCVTQKYFLKALRSLSPSLSPEQLQQHFQLFQS